MLKNHFTMTVAVISMLLCVSCSNAGATSNETVEFETDQSAPPEDLDTSGKKIEMVFCLDATGSMSGLIGTAKEKIWSIVSEVAQDEEVNSLELGMVFYRDRNDAFTTRPISLTDDLDSVYSELLAMNAIGGGDTPESVNQALNEAVMQMDWTANNSVYKTIFVVGDCPPHMDYQDDVKYTESCKIAAEKGITINTIKLGNSCTEAIPHFKAMSECSNGEYLQLDQEASDIVIATPYDEEINEVSLKIDQSRMYYGNEGIQTYNYTKKDNSVVLYENGTTTANGDRSSFKSSAAGQKAWMGENEMISEYANGEIKLEDIPKDELPKELEGKTEEEQKVLLDKMVAEREQNKIKLAELSKKRQAYIDAEKAERGEESSFSKEVVKIMKAQQKRNK